MTPPGVPAPAFREFERLSPNFAADTEHERLGALFHHSVMPFEETLEYMSLPESGVSYHVLIAPSGERCRLVPDERVAWHAGVSEFKGRPKCNAFLIGVSFAGDTYAAPLTEAQIASALDWLSSRWTRYGWAPDWMTDHRQVAPGRKDDLNPVEWQRLAAAIGACHGSKPFPSW